MTIACCEALFYSGYKPLAPQYISLIKISKRQFRVFKLILAKVCILFYFYYTFDDCQNSDLLWLVKKNLATVRERVLTIRTISFSDLQPNAIL